ncbi:MAG TPA: TonB-dependent receptor [Chitinophagaceae bacterium]|nr:TonB-dependent receptor [Chitinophagaceae bacterium]
MKKMFLSACLVGLGTWSIAQDAGEISGSIYENGSEKKLSAFPVALLKAADSSEIKTVLTDAEGKFRFPGIAEGSYLLKPHSAMYQPVYSKPLLVKPSGLTDAGSIQLTPKPKNLKEVTVTSKKPMLEQKMGKTVVHVDAMISNTGSSALDVLERIPGVSVDKDGVISLNGRQGVWVLIDGKPAYLTGQELANYLRGIPSSQLDQVELMTNPPAKYDAAGSAGVINIRTKKNKQMGFNGNLSTALAFGVYPKTNNSLNLNMRKGKVNLFSTLSANYRKNFQDLFIDRRYTFSDKSTKAIFNQENNRVKSNESFQAKLGMDFYATKKTTLGFLVSGMTAPGDIKGENQTLLKDKFGSIDSIVTAASKESSNWRNFSANLNLRHQFDSTGKELTADIDYLSYVSVKDQLFHNRTLNPGGLLRYEDLLRGDLPSDIRIYTAKIDYTQPLAGYLFEAGAKSGLVKTDNTAGYFNITNGLETPDYDKTNSFRYEENINAVYVNLSREFKKWGFQAGLRAEHTNYKGFQFGNPMQSDSSFSRQYFSVFPTLFLSYKPGTNHQFGFNYGRRINRPDYEDLNPFLFFLDKYTYGSGNPYLRPMFSDVLEFSHTYRQKLTTTLKYARTKDLFNETFEERGFATIVRVGNYGLMQNVNISVSAQLSPAKWLKSVLFTEARHIWFSGILYGEEFNQSQSAVLFHVNNQADLGKGWTAELAGFYRTKNIEGQMSILPLGEVNAALQKQVLKKKGSVRMTFRDIFYTRPARGEMSFQNTEVKFREFNDSRQVVIGFTYRFGKPVKASPKRKTGGASDEQNRVKSAG